MGMKIDSGNWGDNHESPNHRIKQIEGRNTSGKWVGKRWASAGTNRKVTSFHQVKIANPGWGNDMAPNNPRGKKK